MNCCRSAPATGGKGRSFTASARSRNRWSIAWTSSLSDDSATRCTLPKHPRHQDPIASRQIGADEHLLETGRRRHLGRSLCLVRRDLAHQRPGGFEPSRGGARDRLDRLQAGLAAHQRGAGLVMQLHRQICELRLGHVRGVRDDESDPSPQRLRERVEPRPARQAHTRRRQAGAGQVGARDRESVLAHVGAPHLGVGQFRRERERQCSGAGAEIGDRVRRRGAQPRVRASPPVTSSAASYPETCSTIQRASLGALSIPAAASDRSVSTRRSRQLGTDQAEADASCSARSAAMSLSTMPSTWPASTWSSACSVRPMRWSVTRFSLKLYVRIFSERPPLFTWSRRADDCSSACRSRSDWRRRDRRMRSAFSLFWSWLFSSWHVTTSPVGRCVMRTAESVVFTDWPPGPLDRYTSTSSSLGSMSMSTASASGSTATVAALVCTRPWLSVAGTRCTRWGPASCFSRAHASRPFTTKVTSR